MVKIAILPILLLALTILAFLVIGVGLLIAKPGTRRVLLRILGIVILVPVFLILLLIGVRVKHSPSFSISQPIAVTQAAAQKPSVWQDEIEKEFRAEVYSSPLSAAYGLGRQIAYKHKQLLTGQGPAENPEANQELPKSSELKKIILCEDTGDLGILQQCRNGLKQSLEDNEILIQPRTASGPSEGQVWILFNSQDEPKAFNVDFAHPVKNAVGLTVEGNQTGAIEAVIQTADDKFSEQVRYDYRVWIHDMPGLKAHYGREWLAVYSDTATDLEQAQKQTYEKACWILTDSVRAAGLQPINIQRENLEQFGLVADTYSQELRGMTGPVWRFALLLDADSGKLYNLVQNKVKIVQHQRYTWVQTALSLLGMMVIIWIAYSVANAATKGYYSTILALFAIIAAVLIGVFLFVV